MNIRKVHLIGIGGIGMANFAVLLKKAGFDITGSDQSVYEPAATVLRDAGIQVRSPYAPENLPQRGTPVIVGNALSRGNEELEAALEEHHHLYSFPGFLYEHILSSRFTLVVAGTHGKSSTAACLAHLLHVSGKDSGYLIGALPLDFPNGGHIGSGESFVIEGDEYDTAFFDKRSKFLHYFPGILVLGPVEYDHADIFANLDEMLLAFRRLLRLLPRNGTVIYAADSPITRLLAQEAPCPTISVGSGDEAMWRVLPSTQRLVFRTPQNQMHSCDFHPLGQHNRLNALMALAAARAYGANESACMRAISSFRGIRRRLERVFENENLVVYDDFAHHPTAIMASIQAIREAHPHRRLISVFEPRSNTMVRNVYQQELAQALSASDCAVVGSVYRAERIPDGQRLDINCLKTDIERAGVSFFHVANSDVVRTLLHLVDDRPTAVLFMSNGSFGGALGGFLRELKAHVNSAQA